MSPRDVLRFVCYCGDCRSFARQLDRLDILDAAGGTEIFQTACGRVRLTDGADALRYVTLSGNVYRWSADCCGTPVANTAPGFPIVAIIHAFVDPDVSRDDAFGPPLCRIYERSATGPLPRDAPPPLSWRVFVRRISVMARARWQGLHRPSPFFDERSRPIHG